MSELNSTFVRHPLSIQITTVRSSGDANCGYYAGCIAEVEIQIWDSRISRERTGLGVEFRRLNCKNIVGLDKHANDTANTAFLLAVYGAQMHNTR